MSNSNNAQLELDLAAFTLSANTLVKLVKRQVLTVDDALECLETTRLTLSNKEDLLKETPNCVLDIDWHLDNITAILEALRLRQKD